MEEKKATKEKIIISAIKLFNEKGTYVISTNHIAKEAGISPGNLYYYFKNKEEIIREIYEKMVKEFENIWENPYYKIHITEVWKGVATHFCIYYRYRFFMSEIVSLIKNDFKLKKRYIEIKKERTKELKKLFINYKDKEVLKKEISDEQIEEIIEILWFMGEFWIMKSEFKENFEKESKNIKLERYLKAIYAICKSYFKEEVLDGFLFEEKIKEIIVEARL